MSFPAIRPYQQYLDAHLQLIDVHRFHQTIVGAGLENGDSAGGMIPCDKNKDRHFDTSSAQFRADIDRTDMRFTMIDDDEVEVFGEGRIDSDFKF